MTLLDISLDAFKGKGHCVTMDSAYMGDTIDQIGQEVQNGRDSPNKSTAAEVKKLKVGT